MTTTSAQVHLPNRFEFSMGGFGPWWELVWESGSLVYRCGGMGQTSAFERSRVPSPAEWRAFWRGMEQAEVWRWQPDYSTEVVDGTSWSLELAHRDREVISRGDNGYPGNEGADCAPGSLFGLFLRRVRRIGRVREAEREQPPLRNFY